MRGHKLAMFIHFHPAEITMKSRNLMFAPWGKLQLAMT